ncbi:hypothetical protein ACIBO2_57355 [Nonomuraea sp. NPDC050022]
MVSRHRMLTLPGSSLTRSIGVRCGRAYDGGGGPSQTGGPLGGGA